MYTGLGGLFAREEIPQTRGIPSPMLHGARVCSEGR